MGKRINTNRQHDLFDDSTQHWEELPAESCCIVELLLTQILIQSIKEQSVNQKWEESNASESTVTPFRKDSLSLSSPIHT